MKKYNVFMEISGKSINVGYITGELHNSDKRYACTA